MDGAAIPAGVVADAAAAVKAFARAGDDADDGGETPLIERLAASAIAIGEAFIGQAIVRREMMQTLRASGEWQRLAARPVTAIAEVDAPIGDHAIDIDAAGDGWVRIARGYEPVRVRYSAGLAETWAAVPAPIAHGVVALAAHLLSRPDADAAVPAAVGALWNPYRRIRLHDEPHA